MQNRLDQDYLNLLQNVLDNGIKKSDRTGTGTISLFGVQLKHKMEDGLPMLTTKKVHFPSVLKELLWFISGSTNIKPLVDNNVNIWTSDAYKKYENYCKNIVESFKEGSILGWQNSLNIHFKDVENLQYYTKKEFSEQIKLNSEFAKIWGELGPTYGRQWRSFNGDSTDKEYHKDYFAGEDQLKNLINDLKTNPDSRRLIVSAWNPNKIKDVTLPPCHNFFQCWTRELTIDERIDIAINKNHLESREFWTINIGPSHEYLDSLNIPKRTISLMVNIRSNDLLLGNPFNIASYGILLQMLANECNMIADELTITIGDAHIYLNHLDAVQEQMSRINEPFELPTLKIKPNIPFFDLKYEDFELVNYKSHESIAAPLSV